MCVCIYISIYFFFSFRVEEAAALFFLQVILFRLILFNVLCLALFLFFKPFLLVCSFNYFSLHVYYSTLCMLLFSLDSFF